MGPYGILGPKRAHVPGLRQDHLPPIHAVLLTNDSYGHLCLNTARYFMRHFRPTWVGGIGLKHRLFPKHKGISNAPIVYTLDWWEGLKYDSFEFVFTPVQGFSGRYGPIDRNSTLWGSYVVRTLTHNIFVCGHGGYSPHFKEIKQQLDELGEKIDIAILPVGGCGSGQVTREVSEDGTVTFSGAVNPLAMSPEEAVQAHLDLGAPQTMGVRYLTFQTSSDTPEEIQQRFQAAAEGAGLREGAFKLMLPGEFLELEGSPKEAPPKQQQETEQEQQQQQQQ